jgi:uncharacterized protein YlxP (DUF503 family)
LTVGIFSLELHLAEARSLKSKRKVVRRLKDRLRARHNVAVAESPEHASVWQRAVLLVTSVASDRDALERLFEAVQREAESGVPGQVIDLGREYLEAVDGGASGWNEDWE